MDTVKAKEKEMKEEKETAKQVRWDSRNSAMWNVGLLEI